MYSPSCDRSTMLRYSLLFLMTPPPPRSTLFPYTTLFRSRRARKSRTARARSAITLVRVPPSTMSALMLTSRSEEHTSELQSHSDLVCRLLLEKKKKNCVRRKCRIRRIEYMEGHDGATYTA